MDIKWKNIKQWKIIEKQIKKILGRDEIWLLLGAAGILFGSLLLTDMLSYRYVTTEYNLFQGGIMNLCFAAGITGIFMFWMLLTGKKWNVQSEYFFQEWEKKQKRLMVFASAIAAVFLIASVVSFRYRLRHSWVYGNLSSAYIPVGTVVVQWIVGNLVIFSYMKKKLKLHMENLKQINQKSLEAALRSEQMKVDLISNVSHDLKTPLTSMVGYIELMKKEEPDDVLSDYIDVLSQKAQKLKEMIDSLFDLAKTSSGNVELKIEQMELNCLIEQVQADMADRIAESGREFVVMLTKEPTDFMADSSYMYRICQNLMENAWKYSQENTRIFLKSSVIPIPEDGNLKEESGQEARQKVRFEITNTSSYQMNFTRDQIVERFARGDESRTTEGNGLGLAIVNTYTAALGGTFDVAIDCDQFKASIEFLK